MSGVGYRRDKAEREARRPFTTGFCGISNPPDSHDRCPIELYGYRCNCLCHQPPAAEAAPSALTEVPSVPVVAATTQNPRPPGVPDEITGPVVITDLPDAVYHAHRGSLSASGAKWLAPPTACPAKFRWHLDHPVTKSAYDFGHVAHSLVLGRGAEVQVLEFDSLRSAAARQADADARAAGMVPILQADYDRAVAVRDAVVNDDIAGALFSHGQAELSLFWPDAETGVIRRARLDWLTDPVDDRRRFIGDLKTSRTSEPYAFGRAAADYGYAISAANYVDGVIACGLHDDPAFLLTAVEKTEPYVVTTFQAPNDVIQLGRALMRQALHTYAECVRTDTWPGYSQGIEQLELPGYYLKQMEEALV